MGDEIENGRVAIFDMDGNLLGEACEVTGVRLDSDESFLDWLPPLVEAFHTMAMSCTVASKQIMRLFWPLERQRARMNRARSLHRRRRGRIKS